ncbi:MAG TPA: DUF4282 domain-containing protein [Parvularculaceae bacterium]|nr:DUF4282 domain-containing protein [Parvularculaceae bacterium]HRX40168.1 DUF4282 domain-containing protein [Parvularculaceae bacterium]
MFLFSFRNFIAPTVIKFFYYIGLVALIFGGLGIIIYAVTEMSSIGGAQAAQMIGGAVIGVPVMILLLRFSTEMWLVLFEMNDKLGDIRDRR